MFYRIVDEELRLELTMPKHAKPLFEIIYSVLKDEWRENK